MTPTRDITVHDGSVEDLGYAVHKSDSAYGYRIVDVENL